MNNFLLLKNELSLAFLRNQDNILATLKSAIKIYGSSEENQRRDVEGQELAALDKILKTHQDFEESKGDPDGVITLNNTAEPGIYEKIIAKLLEYNEKINDGKEISVVDYLKRIDPDCDFMKSFEIQRHIRRAFAEEFKIHALNYILLLFEAQMRILTTI